MRPVYSYAVQMQRPEVDSGLPISFWKDEEWLTLAGLSDVPMQFAMGWCTARCEILPCPGYRVVRLVPGVPIELPDGRRRPGPPIVERVMGTWPRSSVLAVGPVPASSGHQWPYLLRAVELGLDRAIEDMRYSSDEQVARLHVREIMQVRGELHSARHRLESELHESKERP